MKIKADFFITVTLVACALVTTGVVVRREFFLPSTQSGQPPNEPKPVLISHWQESLKSGVRIGSIAAPVQLIEFADFECPYCGTFHKTLKAVEQAHPNQIAVTYFHFPIPGHRFAIPAARVADCADRQGRFSAIYDQLFDGQDQFGLKPWGDYAAAAGVPDLAAFDACVKRSDAIPGVEEGRAFGKKLDVQGTPTVIINGWKLGHPPNEQELDQIVQRVLAGKSPVDGKS
jgi:protein-disulfide isomerase